MDVTPNQNDIEATYELINDMVYDSHPLSTHLLALPLARVSHRRPVLLLPLPLHHASASNWLPGLRRAYARRLPKGVDNPFVRIVRVPVAAPSTEARQPDSSNTTEETSQDKLPDGLGSESAAVKTESGEHGQISDKSTASTKDVPELDDKNVKMATDSSANTTATSSTPAPIDKQLESQSAPDPATPNQDYYEDYIEVDWSEVALDTKVPGYDDESIRQYTS